MAKLEQVLNGDFGQILKTIENGILNGSMSASLEDSSDMFDGDARCSVRVFERYSYAGGNRVSMNVTLFQNAGGPIYLSAITSGGSQAMLFKVNTLGEEAFLSLKNEVTETVLKYASELKAGVAHAKPLNVGGTSPCEYCKMRPVCRRDS